MFHRVIEITEHVNTSAMVLKIVPDILTILYLRCKLGKSIGYIQQIQGTNTEYLDLLNAELQAEIPAVQLR